jgi:hypothetical protein
MDVIVVVAYRRDVFELYAERVLWGTLFVIWVAAMSPTRRSRLSCITLFYFKSFVW